MKPITLESIPLSELVSRFVAVSLKQDAAAQKDDITTFNRLYDRLVAVEREIARRGPEAQMRLLDLFSHPNMQVRLNAAERTLAVAPAAARHELERIRQSRAYPQAIDAGMAIHGLDHGSYQPE